MVVSKSNLLGLFMIFFSFGLGFASKALENPIGESDIASHRLPFVGGDCCGSSCPCSNQGPPANCVGSSNCCGDYGGNPCGPNGFACPPSPSIGYGGGCGGCGGGSVCQPPCNASPPPCQCQQQPCPSCGCGTSAKFEAPGESARQADHVINEQSVPPSA